MYKVYQIGDTMQFKQAGRSEVRTGVVDQVDRPDTRSTYRVRLAGEGRLWVDNRRIIEKDTPTVGEFYATMTDGQKQHMANKLWSDDQVVAQAHKALIPKPKWAVGDLVRVLDAEGYSTLKDGQVTVIVEVDSAPDTDMSYQIAAPSERHPVSSLWMHDASLEKVEI